MRFLKLEEKFSTPTSFLFSNLGFCFVVALSLLGAVEGCLMQRVLVAGGNGVVVDFRG